MSQTLHAAPPINLNPIPNPHTNMHADQGVQNNNWMHWMWVNAASPFMTNGELKEVTESSSVTESDSEIVMMFNLDRLNDDRPV